MIQNAYCAYDPGKIIEYSLNDSIQSIQIQSLYDFNDVSVAKTDLLDFFNIGYKGFYSWMFEDSIVDITMIDNIQKINEVLSNKDRNFNEIYLIFTLKEKPKYEKQRFIVNLWFKSGRNLVDTTEIVNLK